MGKRNPGSKDREEKLKKKREAEKERYKRIMADPDKKKLIQEKEKLKYLRKKQNKMILPISEMTPRQQRKQRKNWKINTRRYREKYKATIRMQNFLNENTPPGSDAEDAADMDQHVPQNLTPRMIAARKRSVNNRKQRSRLIKAKDRKIQKLQRKVRKYKARYNRIQEKTLQKTQKSTSTNALSPPSRAKEILLEAKRSPKKVFKKLLFAESLKEQLAKNYMSLHSDKEKQVFKKALGGKILKKYRVENQCSSFLKTRSLLPCLTKETSLLSYHRKKKAIPAAFIAKIIKEIREFLEMDINSRVCPGKKDYVTKNKTKIQKRFLNDTLKNLHKRFIKTHAYISYRSFCRFKPFYILQMKASDRDTCKCVIHANMEYIVTSLFRIGVLKEKTPSDVVKTLCCDEKTEHCLYRTCSGCKEYRINYGDFDVNAESFFFKWQTKKITYNNPKTGEKKLATKIIKQRNVVKISEILTEFQNSLPKYQAHEGNVIHQFQALNGLKTSLKSNECVIHMDFSENYAVKYADEIQGFHFGGSRQQITLHTVVVYFRVGNVTKNKCFCSLSESLLHNPSAIWAHLRPIFDYISSTLTVDVIHFLSDSPATQYRNKTMFYMLGVHFKVFYPKILKFSYNYSEAGHGKGAPDGIGAVCKRTADRVVGQGKDVSNIDKLVEVLKIQCKGISVFLITDQDIAEITNIIETNKIKPYVGTMQVHQVVGAAETGTLRFRKLSCFECDTSNYCNHYELGKLSYHNGSGDNSTDKSIKVTPSTSKTSTRLRYADVYSSEDEEDVAVPPNEITGKNIKAGTFILTKFVTNKKTEYRYAAVCQTDLEEDGDVSIMCLRATDKKCDTFLANENDISYVTFNDILSILPQPKVFERHNKQFFKFSNSVNVFEQK